MAAAIKPKFGSHLKCSKGKYGKGYCAFRTKTDMLTVNTCPLLIVRLSNTDHGAKQDVDFKTRASLVGSVEVVTSKFTGFSIPNDPENASLLNSKKTRHTKTDREQRYKMQHTDSSNILWYDQNTQNRKIAKKRGDKQAQVNIGLQRFQ